MDPGRDDAGRQGARPPVPPDCPDDNVLAGYADGRLSGARRERVDEHLVDCADCRGVVLAFREAAVDPVVDGAVEVAVATADAGAASGAGVTLPSLSEARERRRRSLAAWAVAAGVLFAVGLGWVLAHRGPADAQTPDQRLVAAAARLATRAPGLLDGFHPADAAERASIAADANRSGLLVLGPAETILSSTPEIAWATAAGGPFTVVVADATGQEVWKREATASPLAYPADAKPLDAGASYVLEVTARGALGETTATRAFRVAPDAERAAWTTLSAGVAASTDDAAMRDVLLAHVAARRGLWLEAEALAARAARASDGGDLARETWTWIRRRLGRDAPGAASAPR